MQGLQQAALEAEQALKGQPYPLPPPLPLPLALTLPLPLTLTLTRQLPTSGGTYDGNPTWKGTGYYKEP